MAIKCPKCGKDNLDQAEVCTRCGVALDKTGIRIDHTFGLGLPDQDRVLFQLQSLGSEGYILGRSDETSDFVPDIDLAAHGAKEKGVSRRHAAVIAYKGIANIIDLHSVNGSYLNNRKLLHDTPYPLNIGDDLRLGHLNLIIRISVNHES